MYLIRNLCPRTDISMGRHAFTIDLSAEWPKMVAASGITAHHVERLVDLQGRSWLNACGHGRMFDPDNCGFETEDGKPLGPNARHLYEPRTSFRFCWGPWGLEHFYVPGNACGLDIDRSSFSCYFDGGRSLCPHNVDSWSQKQMLLIFFCEVAESIVLFANSKGPTP